MLLKFCNILTLFIFHTFVLGGRLCPLCTSAINLLFPTIELISLSNDIAVQIGVNNEDVSGIDLDQP
jgi:hypothetical protein